MRDVLFFAVGAITILTVLLDVFFVVAPRASHVHLSWSRFAGRAVWPLWLQLGTRVPLSRRHGFLSAFAPLFVIGFLLLWMILLIFGYGCLFFALREHMRPVTTFGSSVYFAGTTLLTIGYGDIVPMDAIGRLMSILAGATGVGLFSITIAFLFSLFASFRKREQYVIFLGLRAQRPTSGIGLVESYARAGLLDQFPETLIEAQRWIAAVLESHLAYPPLIFFRTSDVNLSWVGTLVTLLDASALLTTSVRNAPTAEAGFTIDLGAYAASLFHRYFDMRTLQGVPMDRAIFDRGIATLIAAGVPVRDDDEAFARFTEIRSSYIRPLSALGRYLAVPSGEWFQPDLGSVQHG